MRQIQLSAFKLYYRYHNTFIAHKEKSLEYIAGTLHTKSQIIEFDTQG